MHPEDVAPGLTARGDRGVFRQAEPPPGGPDLGDEGVGIPGRDVLEPGSWPRPTSDACSPIFRPNSREG
jgi:hypothetical protein